ncbi:MFS transporter [Parabacteroides sp. PF5-9]|uniref:MFS transporter n=1 Tax=Parabacteroides sp. PF5-9 TaxID=1742404 RepID=UPI0024770DC4|nr:MFS transporter [Parabacteroides sp. PF5-9]MDH6356407.1 MFS family permease [Parabacteroides sp. PF5-9]
MTVHTPPTSFSQSYKYTVLIIICIASSIVPFLGTAVNLALPQMGREFEMNSITQSWILTAYLIASTIFQIPFARLADMVGRSRIFICGLLLVALSSLGCALAYNPSLLIIARAIQGIGSAMVFGTAIAILTAVFDSRERGKVMGINVAVVYLSAALGPSVGGFIMAYWGWNSIFFITAATALTAALGALFFIKEQWKSAQGEPFDLPGSILYGLSLLMIIYGFTILPEMIGFVLVGSGLFLFTYFIFYEKKKTYPVLNVNLFFTNRLFTLSSVAALINYMSTFPISYFFSLYLQEIKGMDVRHAGLILIIQPAIQALISPVAGRLSDKIPSHYLASAGMALLTAVLFCIGLFITPQSPLLFIIALFVLLGIGFAIFSSPNQNAIMSSVEPRYYSTASATTGTMRLTGQTLSMGISTMMLSLFLGKEQISAAVTSEFMQTMHWVFLFFAGLCGLGVYASMARKSK